MRTVFPLEDDVGHGWPALVPRPAVPRSVRVERIRIRVGDDHLSLALNDAAEHSPKAPIFPREPRIRQHLVRGIAKPHGLDIARYDERGRRVVVEVEHSRVYIAKYVCTRLGPQHPASYPAYSEGSL